MIWCNPGIIVYWSLSLFTPINHNFHTLMFCISVTMVVLDSHLVTKSYVWPELHVEVSSTFSFYGKVVA